MAQNENSKISYFNTLIFTIVAAIISLLLLLSLIFEQVRKNAMIFVIALEIGIFTIIMICIWQIVANEKHLNALRNTVSPKISFSECPDYYTKATENNQVVCLNNYQITDGTVSYTILIYPEDKELPMIIPDDVNLTKADKFNLYDLEQNPDFKSARDQCAPIMTEPNLNAAATPEETEKLKKLQNYSKLPWTHAQARCAAYI